MTFFDAPTPEPERTPPPAPAKPEWMGAPEGWLGGFVPVRVVLARTAERVITLGPMEAFPTGVSTSVVHTTRQPIIGHRLGLGGMGGGGEGRARFGVRYSDGSKWQSGAPPASTEPGEPPAPPLLHFGGGGGGSGTHRMDAWLWPLPPAGPVTFAFAWPAENVDETTVEVDGAIFRTAALQAERLWEPLTSEEHQAIQEAHRRLADPGAHYATLTLRPKPGGDEPDDTSA